MKNEVTNFMLYIYNKWSKEEAIMLFGNDLGNHIFTKWVNAVNESSDSNLYWYSNLDNACRRKIVDRANELYNK
jgi:hypothetical protein